MSEPRFDIIDQRSEAMESNIVALTASLARIERAFSHSATKEDVTEIMLYAAKSQRAMIGSIVAACIAVAGVAAMLWPA